MAKDVIRFSNGESDALKYRHLRKIFNPDFLSEALKSEEEESIVSTDINLISMVWNSCQSFLVLYSMFRIHTLGSIVLQLVNGLPAVAASPSHTCRLPSDAYNLLIAILAVACVSVIPQAIYFVYSLIDEFFWTTVDYRAKALMIKKENEKKQKAGKGIKMVRTGTHAGASSDSDFAYQSS